MHFLENSMFVLNAYFCRELRFVAILRSKLRFLLRNTGVDSDFTQNFWGKNWRLGALMYGPTPGHTTHFLNIFCIVTLCVFFHSRSRSRVLPGMIASDSRSWNVGMDFFIPFPFPNFGNRFFHSLPVPELWEWKFFIPFPFPNWPFQSRESKGKMEDCERC